MLRGKKVFLDLVHQEDLALLLSWRNNPEYRQYYREYKELSMEQQLRWYENKILNDDSWQYFTIKNSPSENAIGVVGLTSIHPIYKTAEFAITIGDKKYRNGGYGSDALRVLIKYGFEQLNLNRIWCEVYSNNKSIDMYRHIGFKDEGKLRESVFKNNKYLDSYILGMLRIEYEEIKLEQKNKWDF